MRAISKRIVIASVPLVSLFIAALDPAPRPVLANEFGSPPIAQPRASQILKTGVREPRVRRAPDLVGHPVATARATLESRGLHAGREQSRSTTEHHAGTVLAQDPKPGAPVEPGSAINLWVAVAPPPAPDQVPDRAVPPLEPPRPPRGVPVPDLIHRPANQVASILEHSGLRLGKQQHQESEAAAGTVTRQTPEARMRVRPGTTVDVDVAVPVLISVPDLTGHSLDQARSLLARSRLTAGARRARPSDAATGTVLTQSPIAGTRVRPGTDVDITFAVTIEVSVPDVTGRSVQEAREILSRYRLGLGAQAREESSAPTGTVVSQSPGARTRARPGTAVDVAIAVAILAPVPPSVPAAPVVPPPPAPTTPPPFKPLVRPPKAALVAPTPSAPVATLSAVAAPPVPVPTPVAVVPPPILAAPPAQDPRSARWPRRLTWGFGSAALLLTAGGALYYRRATLGSGQQPVTLPLDFGPHWDTGRQQIGPAGPLRNGSGLRLVSGLEMGTAKIEDDHLVGAAHDTGGLRR
jgi:beta-lactam-binding protein with PASTA domain